MDTAELSVEQLEEMLAAAKAKRDHVAFPKWVIAHESHIVRLPAIGDAPAHASVPAWPACHVNRDGTVTVLVHDEDEEAKATSVAEAPVAASVSSDDAKEPAKPKPGLRGLPANELK